MSMTRTTPQLYRDCLRLVKHIAGRSRKAIALQSIVGSEFRKNKEVTDPIQLEALKANAVRGLSNYLVLESSNKDEKLQKFSSEFNNKEMESIRNKSSDKSD